MGLGHSKTFPMENSSKYRVIFNSAESRMVAYLPRPADPNKTAEKGSKSSESPPKTPPPVPELTFREPLLTRISNCFKKRRPVGVEPYKDLEADDLLGRPRDHSKSSDSKIWLRLNFPGGRSLLPVPTFRKWQIFPGNNNFYLDGRLISSKRVGVFYTSFVTLNIMWGIFAYFQLPFLAKISLVLPIITGILWFLSLATMVYAAFSDPGILPRGTQAEYTAVLHLARGYSIEEKLWTWEFQVMGAVMRRRWCHTCKFYKPPRATHCSICDNCVVRFDHHCPFIGNCVGQRNYGTFFAYINIIVISAAFALSLSCWNIYTNDLYSARYATLGATIQGWMPFVSALLNFLTLTVMVPLLCMHLRLVFQDKTTNESLKRTEERDGKKVKVKIKNPFDHGSCWTNCLATLNGGRYPSLLGLREFATEEYINALYYRHLVEKVLVKRFAPRGMDKELLAATSESILRISNPQPLKAIGPIKSSSSVDSTTSEVEGSGDSKSILGIITTPQPQSRP